LAGFSSSTFGTGPIVVEVVNSSFLLPSKTPQNPELTGNLRPRKFMYFSVVANGNSRITIDLRARKQRRIPGCGYRNTIDEDLKTVDSKS
jgi:hypothetical protein